GVVVPVAVDEEIDRQRLGVCLERVERTIDAGLCRLPLKRQREMLPAPAPSGWGLVRAALSEVLVSAVGAEHVRDAHAAETAAVAVLGGAGRVVGRQVVERRRDPRRVEEVPERHALTLQPGLAADRVRDGVEGLALLVRVAVDEVEDAVRARAG